MAETLLVILCLLTFRQQLFFAQHPTPLRALGLGALTGLTGLCKPVALPWTGFFALVWLCQSGLSLRTGILRLVLVAAGLVLVLAPWTTRNYLLTGRWVAIADNLAINLIIGNEPKATGHYRDQADYQTLFDRLVGPPPGAKFAGYPASGPLGPCGPLGLCQAEPKQTLGVLAAHLPGGNPLAKPSVLAFLWTCAFIGASRHYSPISPPGGLGRWGFGPKFDPGPSDVFRPYPFSLTPRRRPYGPSRLVVLPSARLAQSPRCWNRSQVLVSSLSAAKPSWCRPDNYRLITALCLVQALAILLPACCTFTDSGWAVPSAPCFI